jgi:hypothetical protein
MTPRSELDRERLKARRVREARERVSIFLHTNLSLAETVEVLEDLTARAHYDLRKKAWHREARRP